MNHAATLTQTDVVAALKVIDAPLGLIPLWASTGWAPDERSLIISALVSEIMSNPWR